jgi:hypothetical protein
MRGLGSLPAPDAFKPRGRRWRLVLGAEQILKIASRALPSCRTLSTSAGAWWGLTRGSSVKEGGRELLFRTRALIVPYGNLSAHAGTIRPVLEDAYVPTSTRIEEVVRALVGTSQSTKPAGPGTRASRVGGLID